MHAWVVAPLLFTAARSIERPFPVAVETNATMTITWSSPPPPRELRTGPALEARAESRGAFVAAAEVGVAVAMAAGGTPMGGSSGKEGGIEEKAAIVEDDPPPVSMTRGSCHAACVGDKGRHCAWCYRPSPCLFCFGVVFGLLFVALAIPIACSTVLSLYSPICVSGIWILVIGPPRYCGAPQNIYK